MPVLIVTADDYGYAPGYDRGILEAATAGALDAVSAIVGERCDPAPLLASGVEIGLHLVLPSPEERAGPAAREAALTELGRQLTGFRELFGRPAAHLDGHRHCHAAPGLAAAIGREARERGLAVRSVDARHRRLLRCQGVATPDRLIGRMAEAEPVLPPELEALPGGVTEWMVHPGHRDPSSGSSYDAGREEDLRLLLGGVEPRAADGSPVRRASHRDALAVDPAGRP